MHPYLRVLVKRHLFFTVYIFKFILLFTVTKSTIIYKLLCIFSQYSLLVFLPNSYYSIKFINK